MDEVWRAMLCQSDRKVKKFIKIICSILQLFQEKVLKTFGKIVSWYFCIGKPFHRLLPFSFITIFSEKAKIICKRIHFLQYEFYRGNNWNETINHILKQITGYVSYYRVRRVEKVKSVHRNIFRVEKYVNIFGRLRKVG